MTACPVAQFRFREQPRPWPVGTAAGLGIVCREAAASGLPVLVADSGGAPDAVLEGETGHVVDGRSVAATADRLTRLLLNPALAREMGARGRHRVRAEWSWAHSWETPRGLLAQEAPSSPRGG
ncbi:hypothetical protein SAM40697_4901 [Streptomyces ambofaciens]|uniref:Glycosyl transferase family 1 domain-containing protein n=1 Tax=Streptomyces ambofaciens TaxID=1889 RepID=A0ABM6B509_STRAM|nr:hypothetical protein SAM40697_4901 [Streptomyces ambofaciens]